MNRWLSHHFAWPITERLCGRDTWARLDALNGTDALGTPELRALQEHKLRRLIRHAMRHCPFYADRLRDAGFDSAAAGNITLADLQRVPMLSRQQITENRDAMIWRDVPGGLIPYSTGGSSGEPLQLFIDHARAAADWAARWRARGWWNIQPGETEVLLWGGSARSTWKDRLRTLRDGCLNQHVLSAFDLSPATMARYVERIRDLKPACVYGYASSLALLARFALEALGDDRPLWNPQLRAVFTTGEVLTGPDREAISAAFEAPVAQEYGCRDGGLIGCACPHGSLHVPQENLIIEIVDELGRPVPAGQSGDVVITNLETFGMPIIRYRNGDVAVAGAGRCPCGRSSQYLLEVQGRRSDHLVCRGGEGLTRMHALSLMYVIREVPGVRQFHIHQPSLDRLEVDIVPGPSFTPDGERRILSGLLARMGEGVQIELRKCDHLPPLPSGKHVCVTSALRETSAGEESSIEATPELIETT